MTDLPPDFEIPAARPGRPQRPAIVSFAGWVLIVAGVITGLGGVFYLVAGGGSATSSSEGLAYATFGAAELLTGSQVLRLSAAFRLIGIPVAGLGIVLDIVGLVSGSRWQLLAILLHAVAFVGLVTSAEAFRRRG